jgi:hypothetical protein
VDANETGLISCGECGRGLVFVFDHVGVYVVIDGALGIFIAGEGWGCTSAYTFGLYIFSPCVAIIGGMPEAFVVVLAAVDHIYLAVKDSKAWTKLTTL